MTLGIALRCIDPDTGEESLLFAADSVTTRGTLKTQTCKIQNYSGPEDSDFTTLVAFSGDGQVCDEFFWRLMELLDYEEDTADYVVDLTEKRIEIGDLAYEIYKKYKERSEHDPWFEVLIGASATSSVTPERARSVILQVNCRGNTQLKDDFAIIGSGEYTGGLLLLNEFYRNTLSIKEAAVLCRVIQEQVEKVNSSVGGYTDFRICSEGVSSSFDEEEYEEITSISQQIWNLTGETFHQLLTNVGFQSKLSKILNH